MYCTKPNLPGLEAAFVVSVRVVFPGVEAAEALLLAAGTAMGVSTGFVDSTTAPVAD